MSAPGNGLIVQAFHHVTSSLNKRKCLLGADRELVMIPVTSPWLRYRGFNAIGTCVVCVLFGSLNREYQEQQQYFIFNNKTQMSMQTLCSLSSPRFLHLSQD